MWVIAWSLIWRTMLEGSNGLSARCKVAPTARLAKMFFWVRSKLWEVSSNTASLALRPTSSRYQPSMLTTP